MALWFIWLVVHSCRLKDLLGYKNMLSDKLVSELCALV